MLGDFQAYPLFLGSLSGVLAGVTLVDVGDLRSLLFVGGRSDQRQSYSNSGYFLLGLILQKITDQPYAQALEERVASKIRLKDTYMATERIDVNKNESLTYWAVGSDWKPGRETHPSVFEIVSTPSDMAKFIEAVFDLTLISQQSLDQMKTIRDGEGLGIVPCTFAGKTFYGNTGGGDNCESWLAYEPEEKLTVAYATNAKVYPVAKPARSSQPQHADHQRRSIL